MRRPLKKFPAVAVGLGVATVLLVTVVAPNVSSPVRSRSLLPRSGEAAGLLVLLAGVYSVLIVRGAALSRSTDSYRRAGRRDTCVHGRGFLVPTPTARR